MIQAALKKLSKTKQATSSGLDQIDVMRCLSTAPKRRHYSTLSFDARPLLTAITGNDLFQIPGLGDVAVLTIISECGTDMTRWKSEKHFTSWLGAAK